MGCCWSDQSLKSKHVVTERVDKTYLLHLSQTTLKTANDPQPRGTFYAQVIKVYDGDTVTLAMKSPKNATTCNQSTPIYKYSTRLYGIDTPELRNRDPKNKIEAERARDALSRMILGKLVLVRLVGNEKYGRQLGIIFARCTRPSACVLEPEIVDVQPNTPTSRLVNINHRMITLRHAVEYYGKKNQGRCQKVKDIYLK